MKRVKKLMVANGEYQHEGQTKTRWLEVGSLLEKDGKQKLKLDALPIKADFDGWVEMFDIEPRQGGQGGGSNKMAGWD
jgi:hypothetical protein